MNNAEMYNLGRVLAGMLTVASACIAMAANLPDLELTKQTVAVLTIAQTAITTTLLFLPSVQKSPGTVRGSGPA